MEPSRHTSHDPQRAHVGPRSPDRPEPAFAAASRLAGQIAGCAIGAICAVESGRLRLLAAAGIALAEISVDDPFGDHLLGPDPWVVPDARLQPRLGASALLSMAPPIPFHAGVPIRAGQVHAGAVWVMDHRVRMLTDGQFGALRDLATLCGALLDARLARDPAAQSAQSAAAPARPALRVLYVEDNRINAILFEEAMRMLGGVELRVAETGADALALASRWPPQVLVLDAHLPDTSGYALLPKLRALAGLATVPAFMCSADAAAKDHTGAADFAGHWSKPIDIQRVLADLGRLVP